MFVMVLLFLENSLRQLLFLIKQYKQICISYKLINKRFFKIKQLNAAMIWIWVDRRFNPNDSQGYRRQEKFCPIYKPEALIFLGGYRDKIHNSYVLTMLFVLLIKLPILNVSAGGACLKKKSGYQTPNER